MRHFAFLLIFCILAKANAQTKDWPFPSRSSSPSSFSLGNSSPSPSLGATPPPFDAPLRQEKWEQLTDHDISASGDAALAINPAQWSHGETENFIVHYRRLGDALQVAREIEFDLWYVAKSLGAKRDAYTRKSHVYIFADENEWRTFLAQMPTPGWSHSFALRDELFLNLHNATGAFDSHTLAHETTHAVVARIYKNKRWPLWLNEGFAEYMADASVAARHWQAPTSNQRELRFAQMTVAELIATETYPTEPIAISRLYDSGAKFVRYLFNKYPAQLFPKFVDRLLAGESPATALPEIYGNEFSDLTAFEKRFENFTR